MKDLSHQELHSLCLDLLAALKAEGNAQHEPVMNRARTLLCIEQVDQENAPPPDKVRPGDIWEFEHEVRVKGRKRPITKLLRWEVKGWSKAELAWHLQSLDGGHHTWLMTCEPSYSADLMKRISWGGVHDAEVKKILQE